GQDAYVNDAFGVCHRADASVVGPPQFLPSAAGRLVAREVEQLGSLLDEPQRPFVVVIGGAKVADKLGLLAVLARKADRVLIGGGMAFTFTRALGESSGASLLDESKIDACRRMLDENESLVLPEDFVAAAPEVELELGGSGGDGSRAARLAGQIEVVGRSIPDGWSGYDIGPRSAELFSEVIGSAATVLWNGPMGVSEDWRFASGTKAVAEAVAATPARTVVGGGDSVAALNRLGLAHRIDHVSTGGGASLEYLEHGDLPGLEALRMSAAAHPPVRPRAAD
ncbi:MAG TPA: phosphoglycerate kinase, partial [Acidimicrobiales bacterium]|nr:phosphoglycerate kinase [Acidimicrobiales bacterium]